MISKSMLFLFFSSLLVKIRWLFIKAGCLIIDFLKKKKLASCTAPQRGRSSCGVFLAGQVGGSAKSFPNTQTKGSVCEAESVWIHLHRAEQACWQGNTSGEGHPSTLWLCWRQWHNSNTCRVHASSFLNLLSLSLALCGGLQIKPEAEQDSGKTEHPNNNWSGVTAALKQHQTTWCSFTRPSMLTKPKVTDWYIFRNEM